MVQANMGIGLIPDRAFEVTGAGMNLRAIPSRDQWARRELKIAARDSGQLSGTSRLMLGHLQAAEGPGGRIVGLKRAPVFGSILM